LKEREQDPFFCAGGSAEGDLVQTGYEAIGGITGFELFDVHPPEEVAEVAAREADSCSRRERLPWEGCPSSYPVKPGNDDP